ncbi:MAG: peptidase [Longimonas sp.]|uniref:peptidase n=1 Tax=Longimonas sp. TaxID=2039626 RepID=UPI003976E628
MPASPQHVLFLFIDGIGLGPNRPSNPMAQLGAHWARLAQHPGWTVQTPIVDTPTHVFHPVDATLAIEGLPQSGTGQASLFSGINCAQRAGRHYGPFPHSSSKPVLAAHNLFQRVQPGLSPGDCAFANAYPPVFFKKRARRNRWTVTTLCSRQAGVRLRSTDDVRHNRALPADLVGHAWHKHLDIAIPQRSAAHAGRVLYRIMQQHRLTLFEYYETDKAGHGRSELSISTILHRLDALLGSFIDACSLDTDLLLICSDHGNLEAPNQKPHTRHPVPLVAYGCGAHAFRSATSITDVTPALCTLLGGSLSSHQPTPQ